MKTDVVIVGAGPAGSIAARILADAGVDTLVLEKKQEIGTPKRCAEGINSAGLDRVNVKADPKWAVQEITGAILYAPSEKSVRIDGITFGYVIERKIFEKHLARDAIKAGARYMVKTRALEVIKDGGRVTGVRAEHMGEEFVVESKIVIAADGVDSLMAKSAFINTVNRMSDYHSGMQYEMAGVKCEEDMLHMFFGEDVAPKGYAWIFPKGDTIANVGIGILGLNSGDGKRAKDYLDRFIESNPKFFRSASPIEINTGGVPVSACIETFVTDGFMVVGDAAQQVNPVHGGGIALSMNAARMAAEVAVEALGEGDVSGRRLSEYEKKWRKSDGVKMAKLLKLRHFLEKLDGDDYEKLVTSIDGKDVLSITEGNFASLLKVLVKTPKLMTLAREMLK